MANLAAFLSHFRGLETLAVRGMWKYKSTRAEERGSQLLATTIGKNKETLSFPLVHFNHQVYNNPGYCFPIIDAATKCLKLTQLGMSLPPRWLGAGLPGTAQPASLPGNAQDRHETQHELLGVVAPNPYNWKCCIIKFDWQHCGQGYGNRRISVVAIQFRPAVCWLFCCL